MYILGIGGSEHDFSAALLKDGELICAIEDERLTRVKYSLQSDLSITPLASKMRAIQYCLKEASISPDELDMIITNDLINPIYIPEFGKEVIAINHHLSHAASTFFTSSFQEAAIIIVDAIGTQIDVQQNIHETITLYSANGNQIKEVGKVSGKGIENPVSGWTLFENSIGRFYYRVTVEIGFKFLEEGKTMGLAPYGNDIYIEPFYGFYKMDGFEFKQSHEQKIEMVLFIRNVLQHTDDHFQATADIAFAVQYHLEQAMISMCCYLYEVTQCKNLCLAGGVALNSVANLKVLENTPFEHIYIQPASGDAGTAIGAALYGYHILANQPYLRIDTPFSPYTGKEYSRSEIKEELEKYNSQIEVTQPDNYFESVAKLIADGYILSWFNGRSEIGPRSLGNRSIFVDPRRQEMKDILNVRVKHREVFRPFAPIVLEEYQTEYFELKHPSYYMLLVPPIIKEKQSEIPAVTHVDGTGRVQTVSKLLNPELHALLSTFHKNTGTPILLNTSFNDNGEPIVESPKDAIQCFLKTDIDYLAINGFLVSKRKIESH